MTHCTFFLFFFLLLLLRQIDALPAFFLYSATAIFHQGRTDDSANYAYICFIKKLVHQSVPCKLLFFKYLPDFVIVHLVFIMIIGKTMDFGSYLNDLLGALLDMSIETPVMNVDVQNEEVFSKGGMMLGVKCTRVP